MSALSSDFRHEDDDLNSPRRSQSPRRRPDATSTVRGTRPVRQRSTRRWIYRRPPRCRWQEPSRDRQSHCPLRREPEQREHQSYRLVSNGPSDVFSSSDNHGRTIPLIVPTLGSGFVTDPDALASHSHPIRIKLNLIHSCGLTGRSSELRPITIPVSGQPN